jgi:hypothetical protein
VHIQMAVPEEHVTPEVLDALLEAGTRLNTQLIKSGHAPTFDQALAARKVKWKPEPPGAERFDHAGIVMRRGWGDCDDLGPWKAASMRATGEDPGAQSVVYKSGPKRWHAVVQRSDGELVDPSREAGMAKREGILPAVTGHMFDPSAAALVGEDGVVTMRPSVALKPHPSGGFVGRADIPWDDTDYALTALHRAPVAAQAITGAILGACMVGEAADVARPEHVARLRAICGVISGEQRDRLCQMCGEEAVLGAEEFMSIVGAQLVKPKISAENAKRISSGGILDASAIQAAAAATAAHPASSPAERKLATILAQHAEGKRPRPGGLIDAIMKYQATMFGPVVPGSASEHARLLIADQAAKQMIRLSPDLAALHFGFAMHGHVVGGFDFGNFISDVGKGIGQAAKAVGTVVRDVAPVVATVANVIPPPIGTAISGVAALAGGIAGKLLPKGSPAPSPQQAVAQYAPPAAYAAAPQYRAPAPAPYRPTTYSAPAPQPYAAAQPGMPPPPVHVHMAAAPRGAAASAPVHVSAQPGGPVVIRF